MSENEFDGVWFNPAAIVAVRLRDDGAYSVVDVHLTGGHTISMGEGGEWSEYTATNIAETFVQLIDSHLAEGDRFATFSVGAPEYATPSSPTAPDGYTLVPNDLLTALGSHDPTGADHLADAVRLAEENDDLRSKIAVYEKATAAGAAAPLTGWINLGEWQAMSPSFHVTASLNDSHVVSGSGSVSVRVSGCDDVTGAAASIVAALMPLWIGSTSDSEATKEQP